MLHFASGRLALVKVTCLMADDDLACEDLPIVPPVLQHLQVNSRALLQENRVVLDSSDCSSVINRTTLFRGGAVSRMGKPT